MNIPRRVLPVCVAASLLAFAASCIESKNPLSDEKTSKIDERLIGTWKDVNDIVWKVEKSKITKNAFDVDGADDNGHFTAFTTTVQSKGYLSIRASDDAEKKHDPATYEIYQYVFVDKDTVEFRGMDDDVIQKAIADNKLGGKIVITKTTTRPILGLFGKATVVEEKTPVITDTPENIARYLKDHAKECYPGDGYGMKRVK